MELKQQARNHWTDFLESQGIGSGYLNKKHGPCPMCGGKDRFRYINKKGDGDFICNTCTPKGGDGFDFLMKFRRLEFAEVCRLLEKFLGIVPGYEANRVVPEHTKIANQKTETAEDIEKVSQRKERYLKEVWDGSQDIAEGDVVHQYLTKTRGLKTWNSDVLAFHPGLTYQSREKERLLFPAMLAIIQNVEGKNVSIHRTYLTPITHQKIPAEIGEARKLMSSRYTPNGCAIRLAEPIDGVLGLAEGIETALFCMQESKLPTWSTMSHVFMPMVKIPSHVHTVYIFADNNSRDPKTGRQVGQESATELAKRLVEEKKKVFLVIPPDPDKDWLDMGYVPDLKTLKPYSKEGWGNPRMLTDQVELPDFHESLLPDAFQGYIVDLRETLQCPIEFPAGAIMVAASSVIGAGCEVRPKGRANWMVIPNLWGMLIGYAGSMKTPALLASNSILKRFENMTAKIYNEQEKTYFRQFSKYEVKLKALNEQLKKAINSKQDKEAKKHEIAAIEQEIDDLPEPEKPIRRRFLTNDATVEKIHLILSENHRGFLFFKDELAGLFKTWNKPGRESDREYFMESWTGNAPKTRDRAGGGTVYAPNHCLSLLGSIQPDILRELMASSALSDDSGLWQRFQILFYPKGVQQRWVDDDEDTEAKELAYQALLKLAHTDFIEYGAEVDGEGKRPYFRFDPQAYELFKVWFEELTKKYDELGLKHHLFREHLIKYKSLVPSIALIIHLVDCATHNTKGPISALAVDKAIQWAAILEAHAKKTYSMVAGFKKSAMLTLAKHIQEGDLGELFTVRDVIRSDWQGLKDKKIIEEALEILQDDNWVMQQGPKWAVNPLLKEMQCRI